MPLPTNRTTSDTIEEHIDDHNALNTQHNELEGHAADTSVHGIVDTAQLATQADVTAAVDALVDAAPGTLDTLNELAAALGDDANYATTITTALAGKASTSHHTTHEPGGGDAMAADAAAGTASLRSLGTGATQATAGNDARLSDTRTPTAGSVVDASVSASAAIAESKLALASDAAAATASRRSIGTGATQAAAGNHAHSGTYEPVATAHHARHDAGGADAMVIDAAAATGSLRTLGTNSTQAAAGDHTHSGGAGQLGFYGDGSDGVVNFDGTTTVLGLAPSSGVYTLTRDIFLAGGSQVSGTAVVKCANYRVFCNGTFTIGASATVHNDGNAASGTTGGTATTGATISVNKAGGSGAAGANGGIGSTFGNSLGGGSGASGASSGGPGTGGGRAATAISAPNAAQSLPRSLFTVQYSVAFNQWAGGASGSGGDAAASSTGGGGGASGNVMMVFVYDLVVSGTLRAAGGAGGAGTGAGTGAGGGSGGGGGALIVVYHTKSGTASTFTAATNTPGGAGGAPQGAGKTGAAGSNGTIYEIVN